MLTRSSGNVTLSALGERKGFISVSKLRSYILGDEFSDIIKHKLNTPYTHNVFASQGIKYEEQIMKIIESKLKPNEYKKFTRYNEFENAIKSINDGIPVLSQVPLMDNCLKIRGIADLIVRKDYLPKLFSHTFPDLNIGDNKYVVIDIKFSKIPTSSGFVDDRYGYKFYKYQTMLYTHMLGKIQGIKCKYSFILGKGVYGETGDPFQCLGNIDNTTCSMNLVKKASQFLNCIDFMNVGDIKPNMNVKSYSTQVEIEKIKHIGIPRIPYIDILGKMIVTLIYIPNITCTDPMGQFNTHGNIIALMTNMDGVKNIIYSKTNSKKDEYCLLKRFLNIYKENNYPKLVGYNFYNILKEGLFRHDFKTKYMNIIRKINFSTIDIFDLIKTDFPNSTLGELLGKELDFNTLYFKFLKKRIINTNDVIDLCNVSDNLFLEYINNYT